MAKQTGHSILAKLVVLSSDNGALLQAILEACAAKMLDARVVFVVVSDSQARALDQAEQPGIPTLYHPLNWYLDTQRTPQDYDAELAEQVAPYQPDLIVLAGWPYVLSTTLLSRFPSKIIAWQPTDALDTLIDAIRRALPDDPTIAPRAP